MRYRSKPTEVEAVQWDGENWDEVARFVAPAGSVSHWTRRPLQLVAGERGAQGWVEVPEGHWIVRKPGDQTDHWPVAPDYFAAKYEPVEVPA